MSWLFRKEDDEELVCSRCGRVLDGDDACMVDGEVCCGEYEDDCPKPEGYYENLWGWD